MTTDLFQFISTFWYSSSLVFVVFLCFFLCFVIYLFFVVVFTLSFVFQHWKFFLTSLSVHGFFPLFSWGNKDGHWYRSFDVYNLFWVSRVSSLCFHCVSINTYQLFDPFCAPGVVFAVVLSSINQTIIYNLLVILNLFRDSFTLYIS